MIASWVMLVGMGSGDWGRTQDGRYTPGGACHIRVVDVADALRARGMTVIVGGLVGDVRRGLLGVQPVDLLSGRLEGPPVWPDVVVVQRVMHDGVADLTRRARAAGQVVIQDVDDDFWHLHPQNHARSGITPGRLRDYSAQLAAADLVTVSTPALADIVRTETGQRRVVVIRNAVPVAAYRRRRCHPARVTRVGWPGALPWRSDDLRILRGWLDDTLATTGARLVHIGAVPDRSIATEARVDPTRVVELPLMPAWRWRRMLAVLHVGLVPLSDHRFNRSKSWLKALELAAAGVPVVASPSPEMRALADTGVPIMLADKPADWRRALGRMADLDVRRGMADEAWRVVADRHDIGVRVHEWQAVIDSQV